MEVLGVDLTAGKDSKLRRPAVGEVPTEGADGASHRFAGRLLVLLRADFASGPSSLVFVLQAKLYAT